MDLLTLAINAGAILMTVLGVWKYWLLSKGAVHLRQIYWYAIAIGVLNFLQNILLVMHDPGVWAFLCFQIVVVWSIIMCIRGLHGLDK